MFEPHRKPSATTTTQQYANGVMEKKQDLKKHDFNTVNLGILAGSLWGLTRFGSQPQVATPGNCCVFQSQELLLHNN